MDKIKSLSPTEYYDLIGAGPFNEQARTIYKTIEYNGYAIVKLPSPPGESEQKRITLQEAKNEVAKHHGFHDWENFLTEMVDDNVPAIVADYTDEAWIVHTELNELIEKKESLEEENERLKEAARQDYRVVIEDEVEEYKDRIQVLEEALREAKFVISEHQSVITCSVQAIKEIEQALSGGSTKE